MHIKTRRENVRYIRSFDQKLESPHQKKYATGERLYNQPESTEKSRFDQSL